MSRVNLEGKTMAFAPLFTPIRVGFLSLAVVVAVAGLAPASAQTTGAQTPPAPAERK